MLLTTHATDIIPILVTQDEAEAEVLSSLIAILEIALKISLLLSVPTGLCFCSLVLLTFLYHDLC